MLGRSVGVIAIAATATQAILLPPNLASTEGSNDLSAHWINPESESIKVHCSDCVLPTPPSDLTKTEDGEDSFTIQGGSNSISLDFNIEDDGSSLRVDGYTLYPPSMNFDKPYVKIQRTNDDTLSTPTHISGDSVFVSEDAAQDGQALVRVTYQILSADNHPITVDGVLVTMLKTADEKLMILNVEPVPKATSIFEPAADAVSDVPVKDVDCNGLPALICKIKTAMEANISKLKHGMPAIGSKKGGCKGKMLPHMRPHDPNTDRPFKLHGGPPKFMDHQSHEHHHHHGGHFLHRLLHGFIMVLLPVMMGITMGIAVSMVGMLVGRLVAFLWIKFARGGRRGYASVAQQEEDELVGKDEIVIIEEVEPLPVYEERAPAYTEKDEE